MHPRHSRSLLLIVLLLVLGVSGVADARTPSQADPGSPKAAARKVALGVSMLPFADLATFDAFAADAGRAPAIWSLWSDWGGQTSAFPDTALLDGLRARGSVPMILWQPVDPANQSSSAYRYSQIAKGAHDAYIRAWAQAAKDWGGRVLLRFAHEMDGYWFPWGMGRFNNTPKRFVAAWRHVWNIFRGPGGVGARNVKFVWSPYSACACRRTRSLFPGNRYVDYAAFTAFNWGRKRSRTMDAAVTPLMRAIGSITRKPVIIAELGSIPRGKATWIRKGYPIVYRKWARRIAAIVYFNVDMRHERQPDWRLTSPLAALGAYRKIVAQPRFQGRIR